MYRPLISLSLLAIVLLGSITAATPMMATAQDATPSVGAGATPCPVTTSGQNKALVERYWAEVWRAGGEAAVTELLAPDEIHHWGVGEDTTGTAAFAERLHQFLVAFPDIRISVDQAVAEGDLVVGRWTATATQSGDWQGIAATGRSVTWTGVNIFRISCGQIAESWGEADHLGLRQQLGGTAAVGTPVP